MREILLGTSNLHKAREISRLLKDIPLKIKTLSDFPQITAVKEDGKTLEENAVKKARAYSEETGLFTLADDTGLEVEALGGAPGVESARYAGEKRSYEDNNRKLLEALSHTKNGNRAARFRCVIALADPLAQSVQTVEAAIEGEILTTLRGSKGFGYDPLFYLPHLKKTLAELSLEEKNRISHRALAVLKAKKVLQQLPAATSLS